MSATLSWLVVASIPRLLLAVLVSPSFRSASSSSSSTFLTSPRCTASKMSSFHSCGGCLGFHTTRCGCVSAPHGVDRSPIATAIAISQHVDGCCECRETHRIHAPLDPEAIQPPRTPNDPAIGRWRIAGSLPAGSERRMPGIERRAWTGRCHSWISDDARRILPARRGRRGKGRVR